MPRIPFEEENKVVSTNFDYPRLKLKKGEQARILLLEDPIVEYAHTLRAPQVLQGVPQMVTATRRDGTEYQDYKQDFLSRPLCTGDFSVLSDSGSDPKNCSMCQMAQEHPDWVQAPQRRYAMHIIRYKTKVGGFTLTNPFSVEVLVWAFTDKVFNKIVDFKSTWGDLRKHDLHLGPCTGETFQQFDINVGPDAAWLAKPEYKANTVETFKNNQIDDLSIACGANKEPRWVNADLDRIRESWNLIAHAPADAVASVSTSSIEDDLASLLDSDAPVAAKAEVKVEADDLLDDLLTDIDTEVEEEVEETTVPATDFDDLLAGL